MGELLWPKQNMTIHAGHWESRAYSITEQPSYNYKQATRCLLHNCNPWDER